MRISTERDLLEGRWHQPESEGLGELRARAASLLAEADQLRHDDYDGRFKVMQRLLGGIGEGTFICPRAFFDYGSHTTFGRDCFANVGFTVLDSAEVTIGDRVMFGPNVQLITVGHPVDDVAMRRALWERAEPITVLDDAWIGAGAIILPDVTIGAGSVVGAGAVVTRDVPDRCLALGNPARVVRRHDPARWERSQLPTGAPLNPWGGNDSPQDGE